MALFADLAAWIGRRYPLLSGAGSFANMKLFRMASRGLPDVVWASTRGGRILVPSRDYVGRALFFVGDLDRKVTGLATRLVRPGDVALDIGANYGLVALHLARTVGETGRVHAFEPNPRVLDLLRRTLAAAAPAPVTLHETALGAEPGVATLHVPSGNHGSGSLVAGQGDRYEIPVARLDDFARDQGIERIDFIKIDVEGFEDQVFAGAGSLLADAGVAFVLFEENVVHEDVASTPTIARLRGLGFRVFGVDRNWFRLGLTPIEHLKGRRCHDFLAASPKGEDRLRSTGLVA